VLGCGAMEMAGEGKFVPFLFARRNGAGLRWEEEEEVEEEDDDDEEEKKEVVVGLLTGKYFL
jgi:stringent starvation protein B